MNEILGFVVLSGPFFPMLIWLFVSIFLAWLLSKLFKTRAVRVFGGIGLFVLIFMLPLADEIVGRLYFNYLCDTQAGIKVYQVVELPAKFWSDEGGARFLKPNGDLDKSMLGSRFSEPAYKKPYSTLFGINVYQQQMVDNTTNKALGEVITYMHEGGWVSRKFNPSPSAVRCKNLRGNKLWIDFHSRLFKQSSFDKN